MRVPVVVYADFESFTKPIDSCQSDPDRSFTKAYQKHEPSGFCIHLKCLDKSSEPILFTKTREEENVAAIFVDMLEKEIDRVHASALNCLRDFSFPRNSLICPSPTSFINFCNVISFIYYMVKFLLLILFMFSFTKDKLKRFSLVINGD